MAPLFLGFDLSTQQLKAVLLSADSDIVHESAVHFDRDLAHYQTVNGAIKGPDDGEVTSPVLMWIEAIDLIFERMKASNVDFSAIAAVSGAGQQHGSVYWASDAEKLLSGLDPSQSLVSQLSGAFSTLKAPIWQDSSTAEDCRRVEQAFGGPQALADCTGSRAYERFTGNQISRIKRLFPEIYNATSKISLVSSFIPSLFLGRFAPIELSDASGMNLMDVLTGKWNGKLLQLYGGPSLREKLGPEPVEGGVSLGSVSSWWVKRWGFNPECIIAPFTGDNPATVVSLSAPGDALLSLGTSTTFLLSIPPGDEPPQRFTTSHLLAHPTDSKGQIAMLCYKNGALAREQIRDRFANESWDEFNKLIEQTPPGCDGVTGFYFPLPEIIPPGITGEYFFSTNLVKTPVKPPIRLESVPPSVHPRAILESQFLSIKSRIKTLTSHSGPGNSHHVHRLIISGGSSQNPTIRQLAADIFSMDVYVSGTKEAAGLGGALLAKYAWWKQDNPSGTFEDMTDGERVGLQLVAKTQPDVAEIYEKLVESYDVSEQLALQAWASRGKN